jgi:hypothetical protein
MSIQSVDTYIRPKHLKTKIQINNNFLSNKKIKSFQGVFKVLWKGWLFNLRSGSAFFLKKDYVKIKRKEISLEFFFPKNKHFKKKAKNSIKPKMKKNESNNQPSKQPLQISINK